MRPGLQQDRVANAASLVAGYGYVAFVLLGAAVYALRSNPMLLLLGGGVGLGLLFAGRPQWPALGLLVLWATILDPKVGKVSVGPVQPSAAELVLLASTAAVGLRALTRRGAPSSGLLGPPIAAFVLAAVFGAAVGVAMGESVSDAVDGLRPVLSLTAFFVFRAGFAHRPQKFAAVLVAVAAVGAGLALVGAATGLPLGGLRVGYVITSGRLTHVSRVDPAALRLTSLVLVLLAAGAVLVGRLWIRVAVLTSLVGLEVLSYTRSAWLPLMLAAITLPVVLTARSKWLVLAERSVSYGAVAIAGLALAALGAFGTAGVAVVDRLASTTSSSTLKDSSLQDRELEWSAASAEILRHPFTGIGLNRPYGATDATYDPTLNQTTYEPKRYIHNSLLGVWLWMGLPGVVALLWLSVNLARATLRGFLQGPARRASLPLGCGAGLAVLGVQSTFQTNLLYQPALVALAAGAALLDLWLTTSLSLPPESAPQESVLQESVRQSSALRVRETLGAGT